MYLDTFSFSGDTLVGIFMLRTMEDVECPSGSNCYPECASLGAYFLQHKAVFYPDGMVEFQNPDTFRVQPMAQLGESWMYGTDENGDDLTTTVVQMMDTVILGEPDSVKVISLDNGSDLFLTKYHGIAGVVSDNDTMALTSIPARNLGGSLLTTADVFDFEVGDVLVYYNHYYYRAQEPFQELIQQGTRSLSRFEVLEVITSGDTLKYYFEVTKIYGSFDWDLGFSGFPYGYATDSIWIEFELSGANRLIERPKGALTSMGI